MEEEPTAANMKRLFRLVHEHPDSQESAENHGKLSDLERIFRDAFQEVNKKFDEYQLDEYQLDESKKGAYLAAEYKHHDILAELKKLIDSGEDEVPSILYEIQPLGDLFTNDPKELMEMVRLKLKDFKRVQRVHAPRTPRRTVNNADVPTPDRRFLRARALRL